MIEELGAGEVVVRRARAVDYDDIARLSIAAYTQDGQLTTGHYAAVLADVASRAAAGEVFVAHDRAGEILGSVTLVLPGTPYAELSGPGEAEFRMLAVDPVAQGRGVGEALVRVCVRRASELSATALVICVRDFAEPARRLYTRLGFLRAPELDWQPLPDVTLLALRLPL